jgi:hypothetical protein
VGDKTVTRQDKTITTRDKQEKTKKRGGGREGGGGRGLQERRTAHSLSQTTNLGPCIPGVFSYCPGRMEKTKHAAASASKGDVMDDEGRGPNANTISAACQSKRSDTSICGPVHIYCSCCRLPSVGCRGGDGTKMRRKTRKGKERKTRHMHVGQACGKTPVSFFDPGRP